MYKLLLLDDDNFILASLQRSLRNEKYLQVETFNDPFAAVEHARSRHYDLFLSDYHMTGMDGIEFLEKIRSLHPSSIRILLSGEESRELSDKAANDAGVYCVASKPLPKNELLRIINNAIKEYKTQLDEIATLRSQ